MTVNHKALQPWSALSARLGLTARTLLDSIYTYVHRPIPPVICSKLLEFSATDNISLVFLHFLQCQRWYPVTSIAARPGLGMIMTNVGFFQMSMRLASCRCRSMATASQQVLQLVYCDTQAHCNLCALESCQKSVKNFAIAKCSAHVNNVSKNLSDLYLVWGTHSCFIQLRQAGSVADSHNPEDFVHFS